MKKIIDIVNFNADASCLSSKNWLEIVNGGEKSPFYKWLNLYVEHNKKMVLGLTGATVADLYYYNPESIELINNNKSIFEIIYRPFAHDISLLRNNYSFKQNVKIGMETLNSIFQHNITPYFLPPEFMLTNSQINILSSFNITGTFTNNLRYHNNIARIPPTPYVLKGIYEKEINCIPVDAELTKLYLQSIQGYETKHWNSYLLQNNSNINYFWRDGESIFLIPESIGREKEWLEKETRKIQRQHLKNIEINFERINNDYYFRYQPIQSFSSWMKEFKVLGLVNKISVIEDKLRELSLIKQNLFLYLINSDILSSVEKASLLIRLKDEAGTTKDFTIWRSEKINEAEEILDLILEKCDEDILSNLYSDQRAFMKKIKARYCLLNEKIF